MVGFKAVVPLAAGQTAPPLAAQLQLQPAMPAGRGVASTAPAADTAELLLAVKL